MCQKYVKNHDTDRPSVCLHCYICSSHFVLSRNLEIIEQLVTELEPLK